MPTQRKRYIFNLINELSKKQKREGGNSGKVFAAVAALPGYSAPAPRLRAPGAPRRRAGARQPEDIVPLSGYSAPALRLRSLGVPRRRAGARQPEDIVPLSGCSAPRYACGPWGHPVVERVLDNPKTLCRFRDAAPLRYACGAPGGAPHRRASARQPEGIVPLSGCSAPALRLRTLGVPRRRAGARQPEDIVPLSGCSAPALRLRSLGYPVVERVLDNPKTLCRFRDVAPLRYACGLWG